MVLQGYEINITVSSVDVKQDDSDRPIKVRVCVSLALFAFATILFYSMVFTSRNGYTTWWDLTNMPRGSADFSSAVLAATIAALLSGSLILVGVANYFPSGETLHCDHSTFIASKIPWFNFRGRWTTQTFPISEVSQVHFAVFWSGRGSTTYCIRYSVHGKKRKLFSGIEAPEASLIINGLKNVGVDVVDDPEMLSKVDETLRQRRMSLTRDS